jgi:hypothetical protein
VRHMYYPSCSKLISREGHTMRHQSEGVEMMR